MSFLMTKVGLNVLFSINHSVFHHNIMLLLPYVSQLSNITSQFKDIYGLGAQLLVMIMMACGIDLPRRSSYSIQKWNICNRHFYSKFSNMFKTDMIWESIGNDRRGPTYLHLILLRLVRVMRNVQDYIKRHINM